MSDFFATPWMAACQAPLFNGFSKQEYWSQLSFPSTEDLPDTGIEACLLHWQVDSWPLNHQESPNNILLGLKDDKRVPASSVTHSCPTLNLYNPMDCGPPGSSVHGIFQGRILEWVAIFYCKGSSQPKDHTWVSCDSCIDRWILYNSTLPLREAS